MDYYVIVLFCHFGSKRVNLIYGRPNDGDFLILLLPLQHIERLVDRGGHGDLGQVLSDHVLQDGPHGESTSQRLGGRKTGARTGQRLAGMGGK